MYDSWLLGFITALSPALRSELKQSVENVRSQRRKHGVSEYQPASPRSPRWPRVRIFPPFVCPLLMVVPSSYANLIHHNIAGAGLLAWEDIGPPILITPHKTLQSNSHCSSVLTQWTNSSLALPARPEATGGYQRPEVTRFVILKPDWPPLPFPSKYNDSPLVSSVIYFH